MMRFVADVKDEVSIREKRRFSIVENDEFPVENPHVLCACALLLWTCPCDIEYRMLSGAEGAHLTCNDEFRLKEWRKMVENMAKNG